MSMRRRLGGGALVGLVALVGSACVTNPVGPVMSFETYRNKASVSIEATLSSVGSARIAAQAARDGNAFSTYVDDIVNGNVEEVESIEDTFESIGPPDHASMQLRDQVLVAVREARAGLVDLRTALERDDQEALPHLLTTLDDTSGRLESLEEATK